jgi:hyperosmotically inducible protein
MKSSIKGNSIMKIQLIAGIVTGALLLPIAGYAADAAQSSPTKTYVKDSVITTKVKAELAKEKLSSLIHVSVETDSAGAVTLGGTVKTQKAFDRAGAIATAVKGVTSVQNEIVISSGK